MSLEHKLICLWTFFICLSLCKSLYADPHLFQLNKTRISNMLHKMFYMQTYFGVIVTIKCSAGYLHRDKKTVVR